LSVLYGKKQFKTIPSNTIVNTEKITNIYTPKMGDSTDNNAKSLYDITIDRIVSDILSGEKSLKDLKQMPRSLEAAVMVKLEPFDKYHWQEKILESAITIAFDKSKDIMGDWQKFYDEEGCRDFHEVIYIKHNEHIEEDDYIEINQFDNEFYYTYQKVFHKMFPDPEFADLDLGKDDYF